ncbi:MAG: ECF RNA polymerase sigma factor SigW [Phycisphaeraceae bacterium]|nr:MAG: ECF RNA polymerase sigma factor SigW [Phycisphaeraceae bacterium]
MERAAERKLIEGATKGDRDCAERLIKAHQQSVYAYMLRLSGRHDVAEDIVQEAFVRVLTNLHRFDFRYRFSTWLFTIARRLYLNAIAKHRPAYDSDIVGSARGKGAMPESSVYDDERQSVCRDALQDALNTLSTEQREIIILFHQQDWPIALIAQHLSMPEGTVKSHLHRGRKRLRGTLESTDQLARMLAGVEA